MAASRKQQEKDKSSFEQSNIHLATNIPSNGNIREHKNSAQPMSEHKLIAAINMPKVNGQKIQNQFASDPGPATHKKSLLDEYQTAVSLLKTNPTYAIQQLEQIVTMRPYRNTTLTAHAWLDLAEEEKIAPSKMRKYGKSISMFSSVNNKKVSKINEKVLARAFYGYGTCLFQNKKFNEADIYLSRAFTLFNQQSPSTLNAGEKDIYDQVKYSYAKNLVFLRKHNEAIKILNELNIGNDPELHLYIGISYLQEPDKDLQALLHFQKYFQSITQLFNCDLPDSLNKDGILLSTVLFPIIGSYAGLLFEKSSQEYSTDMIACLCLALSYAKTDVEKAIQYCNHLIDSINEIEIKCVRTLMNFMDFVEHIKFNDEQQQIFCHVKNAASAKEKAYLLKEGGGHFTTQQAVTPFTEQSSGNTFTEQSSDRMIKSVRP